MIIVSIVLLIIIVDSASVNDHINLLDKETKQMDEDRLKHSLAVARKMVEIAKSKKLSEEDIRICFIIGYNHDVGYEFTIKGINHNKIGGEILKKSNFEFWQEIYYHGDINAEYKSQFLDILNQADMQIDKYGNDVGYEKRLEDIKSRYGEDSEVYSNCCKMVDLIRKKLL